MSLHDLTAKRNASLAAIGSGKSSSQGVAWGQTVAEAILAWRSTDGFTPAPPTYVGGDELADARVFAGLHFRTACDDGLVLATLSGMVDKCFSFAGGFHPR